LQIHSDLRRSLNGEERFVSRIVLLYGTCQANAIARVFRRVSGLADDIEFRLVSSFENPFGGWDNISDADMSRVVAYWEQLDERPEVPHRDHLRARLPKNVKTSRFPTTYLLALWPFTTIDPRNVPELPRFPFGRFSWGDSVAASMADMRLADDEIYPTYLKLTAERMPNLDNRLECDILRWRKQDSVCDVKVADYMIDNFRERRLFWAYGHMAGPIIIHIVRKLVDLNSDVLGGNRLLFEANLAEFEKTYDGDDCEQVPLHAAVAEHFKLAYFEPGMKYRFYTSYVTEEEYIRKYVKWEPVWEGYVS
jgi:hypothetical protein